MPLKKKITAKKKTTEKVAPETATPKTTKPAKTTKLVKETKPAKPAKPAKPKAPPKKKKPEGVKLAQLCASAAFDKKAEDLVILDMRGLSSFTDYFVICEGGSSRQVNAIGDNMLDEARKLGVRPLGVEGIPEGRWVLVDFGDVVAHVFDPETRAFYNLEKLWLDAPEVELPKS